MLSVRSAPLSILSILLAISVSGAATAATDAALAARSPFAWPQLEIHPTSGGGADASCRGDQVDLTPPWSGAPEEWLAFAERVSTIRCVEVRGAVDYAADGDIDEPDDRFWIAVGAWLVWLLRDGLLTLT